MKRILAAIMKGRGVKRHTTLQGSTATQNGMGERGENRWIKV